MAVRCSASAGRGRPSGSYSGGRKHCNTMPNDREMRAMKRNNGVYLVIQSGPEPHMTKDASSAVGWCEGCASPLHYSVCRLAHAPPASLTVLWGQCANDIHYTCAAREQDPAEQSSLNHIKIQHRNSPNPL